MSEFNMFERTTDASLPSFLHPRGAREMHQLHFVTGRRPQNRLRRAVKTAMQKWREAREEMLLAEEPAGDLSAWRARSDPSNGRRGGDANITLDMDIEAAPPMMSQMKFRASFWRVVGRILLFLRAAVRWYSAALRDKWHGEDTDQRRAVRLREIIEGLGGTAVKIGQQMAMRIDLMPYVFGVELSK